MARARVCFLGSKNALEPGAPEQDLHHEFQLEYDALKTGCEGLDIELVPEIWNTQFELAHYDAVMVGTTWDYFSQKDAFLARLDEIETRIPVFNPAAVIGWNIEKTYLRELERAGAPSIPTIWADKASETQINNAFSAFQTDRVVIKPLVGGGAWRQALLSKGEPLPARDELPLADCLIQPFLPSVPEQGEYSFLFFGGEYSHALQKVPKSGDYRVQAAYGANEHVHEPRPGELDLCQQVLDAANQITGQDSLLYARVDMVRGLDGQLALMELEIIEPYFYVEQGPACGEVFARALEARLKR